MPLTLGTDAYSKIVAPLIVTVAASAPAAVAAAAATHQWTRLIATRNRYA